MALVFVLPVRNWLSDTLSEARLCRFVVARFSAREAFFGAIPSAARTTTSNYRTIGCKPGFGPCNNHESANTATSTPPRPRCFPYCFGHYRLHRRLGADAGQVQDSRGSRGPIWTATSASIVQCGTNLSSWQGAVFGFPNPIIGLAGFVAPDRGRRGDPRRSALRPVVLVAVRPRPRRRVRVRHLAHRAEHLRARHAVPVVHGHLGR